MNSNACRFIVIHFNQKAHECNIKSLENKMNSKRFKLQYFLPSYLYPQNTLILLSKLNHL